MGRTPLKCLRFQFLKEQQARPDLRVMTGLMVLQVLPDLKVQKVQPVLRAHKDLQVQQDLKDPKG